MFAREVGPVRRRAYDTGQQVENIVYADSSDKQEKCSAQLSPAAASTSWLQLSEEHIKNNERAFRAKSRKLHRNDVLTDEDEKNEGRKRKGTRNMRDRKVTEASDLKRSLEATLHERTIIRFSATSQNIPSEQESLGLQENRSRDVDSGHGRKNNEQQGKKIPANNLDEKTITIVFHAMLFKDYDADDERQKIVIYGEEPIFMGGWDASNVLFTYERNIDRHLRLRGEIKVPVELVNQRCGYKYVLVDKQNKATSERLLELRSHGELTMNRCLVIGRENAAEKKTMHKFDGFIYLESSSLKRYFRALFSSGRLLSNRKAFLREFFPKWSGFCVDSADSEIQLLEALEQLECLVKDISEVQAVDSTGKPHTFDFRHELNISKIFVKILMPKLQKNVKVLESQTMDAESKVQAVLSSVMITYVFTNYHVDLDREQYAMLLTCLQLPPDKKICVELMKNINELDYTLSSFNDVMFAFYLKQSLEKSLFRKWLPALPLLHFLREESKPFGDVIHKTSIDISSWKWWGLGDLPCRHIRSYLTESNVVEILPVLKDLFYMDHLLKRTYLILCPAEMCRDLLKSGCFSCLELSVTMRRLLADKSSSYLKLFAKDLALFFNELKETLLTERIPNNATARDFGYT